MGSKNWQCYYYNNWGRRTNARGCWLIEDQKLKGIRIVPKSIICTITFTNKVLNGNSRLYLFTCACIMTLFLISLRHLSVPPDRTPLSDTSHAFIHFLAAFGVAKQRSGVPPGGNPEIVPDTVRGNMAKVGRLIRVAFDFFSTIVLEFGTYIFFRHSACDKMFSDEDNCSLPLSLRDRHKK